MSASPEAIEALSRARASQGEGRGLRIWVETGIRPQVRMMFDRPSERDLRTDVGGVPVFVDGLSSRFLQDCRIELVRRDGQEGFHVTGPNVPGAAPSPPEARADSAGGGDRAQLEERIRSALRQIFDPEIPMNLIDLGLLYGIEWRSDRAVTIRMTLTSVGCPSTEAICTEVERAAREATGLQEVKVEVVWDPPWTPDRMSLFAKRQFGYV